MKIKISKSEQNDIESSKFFGQAFIPEKWLFGDEFSPTEIFFCQIRLADLNGLSPEGLLPEDGYLYFFFDFDCKPAKGIVRYSRNPDSYTFFNEGAELDYDVETEYPITFEAASVAENGMFLKEKKLVENEICLLKFTPDSFSGMDFLSGVAGCVCFVINEPDLLAGRFDKAFLVNLT
ncbi:MAG: hypothetical protein J6U25_01675 [Clostridia bacterium]|nr:hypothetical protein [Clostridia bacterium]